MSATNNMQTFPKGDGYLDGAAKDERSISADWVPVQDLIDGVIVKEVRNVTKASGGYLTEVLRGEWLPDNAAVDQVFQRVLNPGHISGWHVHRTTTDRLFVNWGLVKIVLYDARAASPTHGRINTFTFGIARPALVVVPPGVWHAVQNVSSEPSALLNLVDEAYDYDDPDHWRLPLDTPEIPYSFQTAG